MVVNEASSVGVGEVLSAEVEEASVDQTEFQVYRTRIHFRHIVDTGAILFVYEDGLHLRSLHVHELLPHCWLLTQVTAAQ